MAWDDDANKNGGSKGPWGSRDQGNGKKPQNPWDPQRPSSGDDAPDLDDMLRQAQDKFGNIFGGGPPSSHNEGKKGLGFVLLLIIGLWLATGFYRVQPGENAVILTFGKWTSTRSEAGLGYHIPWPVQTMMPVNVAFEQKLAVGFNDDRSSDSTGKIDIASESQMLTGDENIVNIDFVVMWKISDAGKFLFSIRDPEPTIKKVAESAMREIIGRTQIQKAMTEGRVDIEASTKELMQKMLDQYESGVVVNSVQLQSVDPPHDVVDAFNDVQRARSDMERTKNEAETYHNDIVPKARGEAQKILQDAEGYKQQVIAEAKGEAARFNSVYEAYAQSKDVTTKRIYIETMEKLMRDSKKVMLSNDKGGVLPYLSLDKLPQGGAKDAASSTSTSAQ